VHESPNITPTTSKKKHPVRRFLFRVFLALFLIAGLGAVAAGFVGLMAYQHVTQPGTPGDNVRVLIPQGATGREVGRILVDRGLIEHELFFRVATRLDKTRRGIKHGAYELPKGLSALELLHLLQDGHTAPPLPSEVPDELRVTVPEGLSLAQASLLFANPQAFIDAASDPILVEKAGLKTPTLEGFLMPNTYFFEEKPTEREVVERMLEQFEKDYAALTAATPLPAGFDKLAVVVVASLVEEEGRVPEERPSIAAVIYNRLKKKMPLQLDSTLQYALDKYGQRLLYEDREVDSPYNTYKNPGLPPGPISSPGCDALKAALNPADADYLYFVSNADGRTHTFSATEAEHLRAVNKFRREIAPQRRAIEEKRKQEE